MYNNYCLSIAAAIVLNIFWSLSGIIPHFVIEITSYNSIKWYKQNLDSVFSQTYPYYRVIYIDDNSID